MDNRLTIEMLKKCVLTNSYPFTHHRLVQNLIASMQREAKMREALMKVKKRGLWFSRNATEEEKTQVLKDEIEIHQALSCEYPAEIEK